MPSVAYNPTVPVVHTGTIREQLVEDLTSEQQKLETPLAGGSSIMLDILCNIRDAMELLQNGMLSSMEYNTASIVAAKHHACKMVLNHSTQSPQAELKEQVLNSKFNDPGAFGDMPESAMCLFYENRKLQGDIRLKPGPVRQEIFSGPAPGNGKKFALNRPSYSIIPQGHIRCSNNVQARGGRRGRGRGAAQKALPWKGPANQKGQGQGSQQNQKKGGAKNSRGGKKGNAK